MVCQKVYIYIYCGFISFISFRGITFHGFAMHGYFEGIKIHGFCYLCNTEIN